MEFFRQGYWSGKLFPALGDLPNPGIEPRSPTLQADSWPAEPQGKQRYPKVPFNWITLAVFKHCKLENILPSKNIDIDLSLYIWNFTWKLKDRNDTYYLQTDCVKSRIGILLEIIENNEAAVKKKNFWNSGYSWRFSLYIRNQENSLLFGYLEARKSSLTI